VCIASSVSAKVNKIITNSIDKNKNFFFSDGGVNEIITSEVGELDRTAFR
jgi:hypothetical protein